MMTTMMGTVASRLVARRRLGRAACFNCGANNWIAAAASDASGSPSDSGGRYGGSGGRRHGEVRSAGDNQSICFRLSL